MGTVLINGIDVKYKKDKTIYELAKGAGINIPTLCHLPKRDVRAVCRICVVELVGKPGLVSACSTKAVEGMKILTHSDTVLRTRKVLAEFMLAEHGEMTRKDTIFSELAESLDVDFTRFILPKQDLSHYKAIESEYIKLDISKCIHCDRCIRSCSDRNVITRKGFGMTVAMAFDNDVAIDDSSCVQCGDCIQACPSGAISAA